MIRNLRCVQPMFWGLVRGQPLRWTRRDASCAWVLGVVGLALISCGSSEDSPSYAPALPNEVTEPGLIADAGSDPDTGSSLDSGFNLDSGSTEAGCNVPGSVGCPCTHADTTADCGRIDYVVGDYVTCVVGTSKCDGTQWGPCTGNRIVAQNVDSRRTSGAIRASSVNLGSL